MQINKKFLSIMIFAALASSPQLAFAAGGIGSSVGSFFETLRDNMSVIGGTVATVAFMWAGFKVMFLGVSIRELGGPLIGAIVAGAAVSIAGLFFGN